VSIDTASVWVSKFKKEGYEGLKDKRKSNGKHTNQELDNYVLEKFKEQRDKGLIILGSTLQLMALNAPSSIRPVDFKASKGWLNLFLKRNNISRRRCTQKLQTFVSSLIPEINGYLHVLEVFQDHLDDYVFLNFDEVPFFFDMASDYTFHNQGERNIAGLSHKNNKVRATFMPTICSNGHSLPPLIVGIYPYGAKSGRGFPKKYEHLQNLTKPYMLRFTDSGFTKDYIIVEYLKKVVLPYQERINKKICLLFDQAPSHTTSIVKDFLDENRITYLFIPSGATFLLQPLDVVLNKPLKDRVRKFYFKWLLDSVEKNKDGIIMPPSLDQMIDWCTNSMESIEPQLITKAFETCGISRSLAELYDQNLISQRLHSFVEDYFIQCDLAASDEEFGYNDSTENELRRIYEGQILDFE